jgi:hypothetical protein
MPSIHCVPASTVRPRATPIGTPERDDLGTAMTTLREARIKLAGSITERDFDLMVELRRDLLRAVRLLRNAAKTGGPSGLFGKEYLAGSNDALRAARAIGRAWVALSRFAEQSGGYNGFGWPAIEAQTVAALERAKVATAKAEAAAYTGTHY